MAWVIAMLGSCEIIAKVYLVCEDFFATGTLHGCDRCLTVGLCQEQEEDTVNDFLFTWSVVFLQSFLLIEVYAVNDLD